MNNILVDVFNRIQPVRDNLLSCLKPKDITNLCIAINSKLTNAETIKYMSIIRLLPINLAPIQKTIYEQGKIYIIGKDIENLNNILNSDDIINRNLNICMSLFIIAFDKPEKELNLLGEDIIRYNPIQGLKHIDSYRINKSHINVFTFTEKNYISDSNKFNKEDEMNILHLLGVEELSINDKDYVYIVNSKCTYIHKNSITTHDIDCNIYRVPDSDASCWIFNHEKNVHMSAGIQSLSFDII